MSAPGRFLRGVAQALSAMSLYRDGHPSRDRAVDGAFQALLALQEGEGPVHSFTFLEGAVVHNGLPDHEFRGWDWGARLSAAGIQRVETSATVPREEFELFLGELLEHLLGEGTGSAERRQTRVPSIIFGRVSVDGDWEEELPGGGADPEEFPGVATLLFSLREEAAAVEWLHDELRERDTLHMVEAEAVVRSLAVAMHGDQELLLPLLRLKRFDQYTTTHALNVAVLSMALAEYLGLPADQVRAFGISGLLHDLGKVRIPEEILNKPGKLTDSERAVMNSHPAEGARIILESRGDLDLAATVAYEHHIRIDGGGYPNLHFCRTCHAASNLVHLCNIYNALRTHRPYRGAWEEERVMGYLEEGAGTEFDPQLTRAFLAMLREWGHRIATLESPEDPVRGGEAGGGDADGEPPAASLLQGDHGATGSDSTPADLPPGWPPAPEELLHIWEGASAESEPEPPTEGEASLERGMGWGEREGSGGDGGEGDPGEDRDPGPGAPRGGS